MFSPSLLKFITLSLCFASIATALPQRRQTQDYTATTPVMGYNTYNPQSCNPTQTFAEEQIAALAADGYLAAGYNIFQVDCGWQKPDGSRNSTTGAIAQNLDTFPGGLEAVSTYATSRGFHFATYSDAGLESCGSGGGVTLAGSLGHEQVDAEFFKSLNSSYVKYDNCYPDANTVVSKAPRTDFPSRFGNMTKALRSVGITAQMTCQWGVPYSDPSGILEGPVSWSDAVGTSFRVSDDISDDWPAVMRIYNQASYVANTGLTGPGFHGDADLLEVGNSGLTFAQQQTHFAYWAMAKSALVISTDVTQASAATKALLQNAGLIKINQDSLGKPVRLVQRYTNDYDLQAGPLSDGDLAVLAINMQDASRSLTIDFSQLNVTSANVVDLLTGMTETAVSSYTSTVDANAPVALRLSNVVKSTAESPSVTWYQATNGVIAGSAGKASCSGCSDGEKVSYIGGSGNTLTINDIDVSSSTATLLFDYINCDIGYLGQVGGNQRTAQISVNGGAAVNVSYPISGYNWSGDLWHNFRVQLSGFNPGNANSITISAPDGSYAPDLDRIGVLSS